MTEFKVMPWLRALRDRSAKEQVGLSVDERLRRSRARAAPLTAQFLKRHPEARSRSARELLVVAEERPEYGRNEG